MVCVTITITISSYHHYTCDEQGERVWYVIDARNMVLGRLASTITPILQGKTKPTYSPMNYDVGDHVIVINSQHIVLTGSKWKRKLIRWHTGWIGGLKEYTAEQRHTRDPTELVRRAVNGMLPKSNIRKTWMNRLHVYSGDEHPHESQNPLELDPLGEDAIYKELRY